MKCSGATDHFDGNRLVVSRIGGFVHHSHVAPADLGYDLVGTHPHGDYLNARGGPAPPGTIALRVYRGSSAKIKQYKSELIMISITCNALPRRLPRLPLRPQRIRYKSRICVLQ